MKNADNQFFHIKNRDETGSKNEPQISEICAKKSNQTLQLKGGILISGFFFKKNH